MGTEGIEADIEARGGDFGAGTVVGDIVELVEKSVVQRGRESVGWMHAGLGNGADEIGDDEFERISRAPLIRDKVL